jgi:hypothetical protein
MQDAISRATLDLVAQRELLGRLAPVRRERPAATS